MSKLLIPSKPLVVIPQLAHILGVDESAILQQIHYWINEDFNKNFRDGRYWVYNSYEDWQKQFPWMSTRTLRRKITSLEEFKVVISANYNTTLSRVKWYTIDYERLDSFVNIRTGQIGHLDDPYRPNWPHGNGQIGHYVPYTEITTETTTRAIEDPKAITPTQEPVVVFLKELTDFGYNEFDAKQDLKTYGEETMRKAIEYVKNRPERPSNPAGYIRSVLSKKASLEPPKRPSLPSENYPIPNCEQSKRESEKMWDIKVSSPEVAVHYLSKFKNELKQINNPSP